MAEMCGSAGRIRRKMKKSKLLSPLENFLWQDSPYILNERRRIQSKKLIHKVWTKLTNFTTQNLRFQPANSPRVKNNKISLKVVVSISELRLGTTSPLWHHQLTYQFHNVLVENQCGLHGL